MYETSEQVRDSICLTDIPDREAMERRFIEGFYSQIQSKKQQAVFDVLREELKENSTLLENQDFLSRILMKLDDTEMLEQPFIMLSVNNKVGV